MVKGDPYVHGNLIVDMDLYPHDNEDLDIIRRHAVSMYLKTTKKEPIPNLSKADVVICNIMQLRSL